MADDPTRPGHDVSYGLDTSLLESLEEYLTENLKMV